MTQRRIWFQSSAYWGPGWWMPKEFGRDLGRVHRNAETGLWEGWKDQFPPKGKPQAADVTGCATRQDAAEALRDLWDDSHGPAPSAPEVA
jgi:hypothetical protein